MWSCIDSPKIFLFLKPYNFTRLYFCTGHSVSPFIRCTMCFFNMCFKKFFYMLGKLFWIIFFNIYSFFCFYSLRTSLIHVSNFFLPVFNICNFLSNSLVFFISSFLFYLKNTQAAGGGVNLAKNWEFQPISYEELCPANNIHEFGSASFPVQPADDCWPSLTETP